MKLPIQGGCACGAIRYECSAEPIVGGFCYCRDCQRATGSAMMSALAFPAGAFRVTKGKERIRRSRADSGNDVDRGFCADCGSPLYGRNSGAPMVNLAVGSLDDPAAFSPNFAIYTSSAHPWSPIPEPLPRFEKMPPM